MTLNRRALIVIFPVILLGNLLAGIVTYRTQRSTLIGLEQAKLAEQAHALQSAFGLYRNFNIGLLNVIRNSSTLSAFINETNEAYRSEALGVGLQQSVHALAAGAVRFVSCAIFAPDGKLIYYYDSSIDPFAGISAEQSDLARRVRSGSAMTASNYLPRSDARSLLVISSFVSPIVAAEPLAVQRAAAFMIQIAVQPTGLEALTARLEHDYRTRLQISTTPLPLNGKISQVFALQPELYARLTPAPSYLGNQLWHLAGVVLFSGITMSLVLVSMLMLLVRRYITGPIEHLDRQVTEVIASGCVIVSASSATSEVGRLSRNVETLRARADASLQEIRELYWTDHLTGIDNRVRFNMLSAQWIEEASGTGSPLALLFIDLDCFKFVNDRYGHEAGDSVLITVAEGLRSILREASEASGEAQGMCARLSGDEFAVLVRSNSRGCHVSRIVSCILDFFKGGLRIGQQTYPVTASIGIASAPADARTVAELIACADRAMYQAKSSGRNAAAHFSLELLADAERRRVIEQQLKHVDTKQEFSLTYLPVLDRHGQVVGCSSMMRWNSPALGIVPPAEFIPAIEATGLYATIDNWVVRQAIEDYPQLRRLVGADITLGMTISSAHLYSQDMGTTLCDLARKQDMHPSQLELTLTDVPNASELHVDKLVEMNRLRGLGFRIAINVSGNTPVILGDLVECSADIINMDMSFIHTLTRRCSAEAARSIIELHHASGVKIAARFVDSAKTASLLANARCDYFQGPWTGPPLSLEEMAIWNAERRFEINAAMDAA